MKILFTGDWQADPSNLDRCEILAKRLLREICPKYKIGAIVHCGDFKNQYSPVDVEVTNFATSFIRESTKLDIPFFIDLGNHDRIGIYRDDRNWFSTLRAAGAHAFDTPDGFSVGPRAVTNPIVYFLPFRSSNQQLAADAERLAGMAKVCDVPHVLVFHAELKGSKMNSSAVSENGIAPGVLQPKYYDHCIGGHLHWQQNVGGNVWYVGSPFPMDWGEANQEKAFLVFDSETRKLWRIPTGFAGWYDPDLPNFREPQSWNGAKVRVRTAREMSDEERVKTSSRFAGADMTFQVVPVESMPIVLDGIDSALPDERKITEYIERTLPDDLKPLTDVVKKYMRDILTKHTAATPVAREIRFCSVTAHNVLSYQSVSMSYEPGISIVRGINGAGSVGAGKTNLLSLPSIALFGTTFKGQKHDRWIHRWTTEREADVTVEFEIEGRMRSITRSRNPATLRVFQGGEEISRGNRKEQTQKAIEDSLGFSWETFANTLYIDQKRENVMLGGRDSERKQFLAKMHNLERFGLAQKAVTEKRKELQAAVGELDSKISSTAYQLQVYEQAYRAIESLQPKENPENFVRLAEEKRELVQQLETQLGSLSTKELAQTNHVDSLDAQIKKKSRQLGDIEASVARLQGLENEATCPTCLGPIDKKHVDKHLVVFERRLAAIRAEMNHLETEREQVRLRVKNSAVLRQNLHRQISEEKAQWYGYKSQVSVAAKQAEENQARERKQAELQKSVDESRQALEGYQASKKKFVRQFAVIEYSERAFSRDGLPAFLLASLVPKLNAAARFYSDKFSGGAIQVKFLVTPDGEADVLVDNPEGGELMEDQSGGETRMASLIVSFALRESAPKTNLLILDEPGDGLDPARATQFAKGLREVAKRFGTILLTTHNPVLLGELSGLRVITVVKENGVSRVEETT